MLPTSRGDWQFSEPHMEDFQWYTLGNRTSPNKIKMIECYSTCDVMIRILESTNAEILATYSYLQITCK
jgi:hypothetical protein